jgi:hypothetical protein
MLGERIGTAVALVLLFAATPGAAANWTVTDPGQGPVVLRSGSSGASGLSGLTWVGGDLYYAVSDTGGRLFPLRIAVDSTTGAVASAAPSRGVRLVRGVDLEGVAWEAKEKAVLVSDETGPALREHDVATGEVLRSIPLPAVFAGHRRNLSLESLSVQRGGDAVWTANEEALEADGEVSSLSEGSTVRLLKLGPDLRPAGEWAYRTDPLPEDTGPPGRDIEASGVSDLVALPDGTLLVLERGFGGADLDFRIRLYEVSFAGATDVSTLAALRKAKFVAVGKALLWERRFKLANFEGIALGPRLAGGAYSLLMVSDDGQGARQELYALTISESRRRIQPPARKREG